MSDNEKFDLDQLRLGLRVANECLQDLNKRVTKLECFGLNGVPVAPGNSFSVTITDLPARVAEFVEWACTAYDIESGDGMRTRYLCQGSILAKLRELGLMKEKGE